MQFVSNVSYMTREDAYKLLTEFTLSDSLIKHALAVEAAMRHYAGHFQEDVDLWGAVGLLHDFDYEQNPTPPEHTRVGAQILRERGIDETIVGAMLSHAEWNLEKFPRDTLLRRCLFAVDELAGFVMAVAYVRPERLHGMSPGSVRKKMKQKSFAAAVSRDDIERGAQLISLPLDEHIQHVIAALQQISGPLGFGVHP